MRADRHIETFREQVHLAVGRMFEETDLGQNLIILRDEVPGALAVSDPTHSGAIALWQERRTAPRRVGAWLDPHDLGRSAATDD